MSKQTLSLPPLKPGRGTASPSWCRLEVSADQAEFALRVDASAARAGILPIIDGQASFLLRLSASASVAEIELPESSTGASVRASAARPGDFLGLAVNLLRRGRLGRIRMIGNDIAYLVGGAGPIGRDAFSSLVRRYRRRNRDEQMALQLEISEIHCASRYPGIDEEWSCARSRRTGRSDAAEIAVYIHLFHAELWPDFCAGLSNIEAAFDLHVSMPETREALRREILAEYPAATFHLVDNRGRDIWPFIQLLQSGLFDGYTAVCKLHSKTSDHLRRADIGADLGRRWRRSAILELMGRPERVERIVRRIRDDESVGLVGPTNLWIRGLDATDKTWGMLQNRPAMRRLAERLRIDDHDLRTDFFAGTMFWFAPRAMQAIRNAGFRASDFEPEPIPKDGTLPHGMERMFNIVVTEAGFSIAGSRDA